MSSEMENRIETEAPPPVSSLRSRWEAMSKKAEVPEESKGVKTGSIGVRSARSHKTEEHPTAPTVVISAVTPPSTTPNAPLRRVVSNPTSQPISPDTAQLHFTPVKSPRRSPSNSRMEGGDNGDEEEGDETPISATPRRSPSTPSFGLGNKTFGIGLGAPPGMTTGGKKTFSVSSAVGFTSIGMNGPSSQVDNAITDVEELSRKLSRRPPPPPPGKKPPPPAPPTRTPEGPPSISSSRSITPPEEPDDTRRATANPPIHVRSDSSGSTLSLNPAPPLPARNNTSSPAFPQRPTVLRSPALPPRSADVLSPSNTLVYHPGIGFHTPSTEHLSPAGSDGSENSKPSLIPPKLPFRSGNNSAPVSPVVTHVPPLPRRNQQSSSLMSDQSSPVPPRLPPRSAMGSGVDQEDHDGGTVGAVAEPGIGRGNRRVPPPPSHSLRPTLTSSSSPSASRESLTPTEEAALHPPPPPQRTPSGESFLPPPSRINPPMNDGNSTSHSLSHHHHHHHFPHLPHQLNSLPITKILAAVRLGGSQSSSSGSKSPRIHTSPSLESQPNSTVELTGTAGLPPPPVRHTLRPNSSKGRHDQDDGTSSDEDDEVSPAPGNGISAGGGGAGGNKRPIGKVAEELPDSSRSNRRPPILPEFQHPPAVHAAHHHFFSIGEGVKGTEIRVPSHSGVIAVAGWWVVVASPGIITVTNMNVADRERGGGLVELSRDRELEMELAMGVSASNQRAGGGGAKGVWTIEMKEMPIDWKVDKPRVTAMEFRHGSSNRPPANLSRSSRNSSRTAVNSPFSSESDGADDGRYIWCGTRDGCLFELDVWNGGRLNDLRMGAHSGHVTGIFRLPGHRMITVDEHGKCLVFCGVGMARGSEENLSSTSLGDRPGGWLSRTHPRVHRIQHREGFMRVLNGSLWTSPAVLTSTTMSTNGSHAAGSGESFTSVVGSGGSLASIAHAATKQHRHHEHHRHHRRNDSQTASGPLIRIHDINDDGALVTRTVVSGHNVGPVTCGTALPSTPGIVYLGHEGGHVTVWGVGEAGMKSSGVSGKPFRKGHHSQDSLTSTSSSSTCSDESESHTEDESPTIVGRGEKGAPLGGGTNGPVCLRKVKISISDVISLEGVGSRLWAGTRKGLIYAYDVAGNKKEEATGPLAEDGSTYLGQVESENAPWVVTNIWRAHGEFPVARIVVDPFSVAKVQKLVVYSVGRDETVRFWDGFLSQNWIDLEMLTRETSFCTFRPLKMLICTWNIDAAKPDALTGTNNVTFLQKFLTSPALEGSRPDMIVFGFQEVIDLEDKKLTAKTVLLGTGKKRADGTISAKVSRHYRLWHDRLTAEVQRAYPSESYIVQHTENLVGLFTCVFVRRELAKPASSPLTAIRDVSITTIKCGMHGMYGNKGAIVARFIIDDTSLCFLNCHLAAGQGQKVARNMDLASILEEKSVFPVSGSEDGSTPEDFVAYVGGGDGSMVLDHELCFLNGDLNYRIEQRRDAVVSNIQSGKLSHLLQYDQLLHEMHTNPTFRLRTFTEPPITFTPTYKYDRYSTTYDSSDKRRIPAWCDRILYRSRDPSRIENLWYGRYEPDVSDHRPVCGVYRVVVKKVVPGERARELALVRRLWEKELVRLCAEMREFYEGR